MLSAITEKLNHPDRDFRYMGVADLLRALEKDSFTVSEGDGQMKLVRKLIELLGDSSPEVQNLSIQAYAAPIAPASSPRSLTGLVDRVQDRCIETMLDELGSLLFGKKSDLRDPASLALKSIITSIPPKKETGPRAQIVARRLGGRLVAGLATSEEETVMEVLDLLPDILRKFAPLMTADHQATQAALLGQLLAHRPAIRKRANVCLAYLSTASTSALFDALMDDLYSGLTKARQKEEYLRTYAQAVGVIGGPAGFRMGAHLERFIPALMTQLNTDRGEEAAELREYCLRDFEVFVRRCPKEVGPHLDAIVAACLQYIKYDPLLVDNGEGIEAMEEEEEEEEDDDDYDDDDTSWKVRKASAKCLTAVIAFHPSCVLPLLRDGASSLSQRFKEREETVRLDVVEAYHSIIRQVQSASRVGNDEPANALRKELPHLVKAASRQLKDKSVKARSAIFLFLRDAVIALPNCFAEHASAFIPGIRQSLSGRSTTNTLKIEALSFTAILLSSHDPSVFHPHLDDLAPLVFECVADRYFKIASEALRVCGELVHVLHPSDGSPAPPSAAKHARTLFDVTLVKMKAQDIDQEVKEAAIVTMGRVITLLPEVGGSSALPLLLERLGNEITRVTAIKALGEIALAKVDLNSILTPALTQLTDFLRKNNRALRLASLNTLVALVSSHGKSVNIQQFESMLTEAAPLISDADLQLSHQALALANNVIDANAKVVGGAVKSAIFPRSLDVMRSALLQGAAMNELLGLYERLVVAKVKGFDYPLIVSELVRPLTKGGSEYTKQVVGDVAQGIGVMAVTVGQKAVDATVTEHVSQVKSDKTGDRHRLLSLLVIAEIGRRTDLSKAAGAPQNILLASLDAVSEEHKTAAAYALGCLCLGSLQTFLPFLLGEIKAQPRRLYLLLIALKEVVSSAASDAALAKALSAHGEAVMALLQENSESEEEGTRNVVAECMGGLLAAAPQVTLPRLLAQLKDNSPLGRAVAVSALKFTASRTSAVAATLETLLAPEIDGFLSAIEDADLGVRRAALQMITYFVHHKASVVRPRLPRLVPLVYAETAVRADLIREYVIGPFKHKVDEGLDLRKASFECMYTLLETCMDMVDVSQFLVHLSSGLGDQYDIQLLCHIMLTRLARDAPAAVLEGTASLIPPLKATVTTKIKDSAVKQEVERNEEQIRSALRAIAAISRLRQSAKVPAWAAFMKEVVQVGQLAAKYAQIDKDIGPMVGLVDGGDDEVVL